MRDLLPRTPHKSNSRELDKCEKTHVNTNQKVVEMNELSCNYNGCC